MTRTLPDCRQHIPVPIFSESVKTRRGYRDPQRNEVPGWTQRYLSRIYRDKQRRSSGITSVYHKDDRSRARTVRLLADLKRHQDSRNPHGAVPGECHQDRELAEGTAGCKTCILSGTSGTPGI